MAKLFIYYSFSGNGDIVASKMKENGYEIRKVESKLKLSKVFFFSMMQGGFLASIGAKPKLVNFDNDINNYDEICIGSPIWNGRLCPPINSVLNLINLDNKKIKFILYSGSGEGKKAYKKINKKYNAEVIFLKEPKKYNNELERLGD